MSDLVTRLRDRYYTDHSRLRDEAADEIERIIRLDNRILTERKAKIESDAKVIATLREELHEAKTAGAHAALELAALKKLLSDEQTVGEKP